MDNNNSKDSGNPNNSKDSGNPNNSNPGSNPQNSGQNNNSSNTQGNQSSNQNNNQSQQSKFSLGSVPGTGAFTKLKSFVIQCKRVWHVLKKPDMEEFKSIAKISALGLLAIGAIGFIIADIIKVFAK